MKQKKTYGYRNRYNIKYLEINLIRGVQTYLGTASLLRMDKVARDKPQASQVIKSAACVRPHRATVIVKQPANMLVPSVCPAWRTDVN